MPRNVRRFVAVPAALALALAVSARGDDPKPKPPPAAKPSIPELLAARVTVPDAMDAPFPEVMDFLRTKFKLPILVDDRSILGDAMAVGFDGPVKLPRVADVRAETLLRAVLDQVNGAFLVYPDHIKVVSAAGALYETRTIKDPREAAQDDPNAPEEPALLPHEQLNKFKPLTQKGLVNANYKNAPLSEVLADIADATGANVVLAAQARAAGLNTVSVKFANTPVDAAVRTLCEMTDLAVLPDANVLLVTTRERAAARQKEEDARRKARQPAPMGNGFGLGGGGGLGGEIDRGAARRARTAEELAELKEQNEALKKQLDEIQKLLKK